MSFVSFLEVAMLGAGSYAELYIPGDFSQFLEVVELLSWIEKHTG
jgi:hypothetical protein